MINLKSIACSLLILLLSQQVFASARLLFTATHLANVAMADSGSCSTYGHHSQSTLKQCHLADTPTAMFMSDHKSGHGTHCENCISGCQPLTFISSSFNTSPHCVTTELTSSTSFIPLAPINTLFRPPITA